MATAQAKSRADTEAEALAAAQRRAELERQAEAVVQERMRAETDAIETARAKIAAEERVMRNARSRAAAEIAEKAAPKSGSRCTRKRQRRRRPACRPKPWQARWRAPESRRSKPAQAIAESEARARVEALERAQIVAAAVIEPESARKSAVYGTNSPGRTGHCVALPPSLALAAGIAAAVFTLPAIGSSTT